MGTDEASAAHIEPSELPRPTPGVPMGRRRTGLAVALVGLPLLTLVLVLTEGALGLGSVLLLYLLADVVVAAIGGLPAGLLAAGVSVLAANWFFVPPFHTLAVETGDSVIELVVFAVVALIVSLTVDLAARDRAHATRSALEAALLARFAATPAAELSLSDALERVRTTFGMTSAALVRQPTATTAARTVVASVGPRSDTPPSIRITAGPGLVLEAHGPALFAEDRRLLERLAAVAARAWEGQLLAAQADALAETDRGRSALLAAVGHDLRTPLTGLKAAVSSLRQDDIAWSEDEEQELLATIEDSSDRLTELIANLLDMSRLEVGGITAHATTVAVDEVVSRAVLGVPSDVLSMDVPDDLPLVRADPGLLERVVANLVDNARRHSPPGSRFEVTAGATATHVHVRVLDHGQGVASDQWSTMFEPFQRLDDRSASTGVGLGLAIVKGFCEAMDVAVVPSITPGGGLTMTLKLPVAQP
jgi:two-component system sensor histidine kinase KdpD